jgi:Tol biopolymer transport system component
VPLAGGKSTLLISLGEGLTDSGDGSLSPDGSLVTFLGGGSFESGHCGPCRFVANADGTEMRVIRGCWKSNPSGTWSPDGSRIVCLGSAGDRIDVLDIATGEATPVARGSGAIWLDEHTLLVEV